MDLIVRDSSTLKTIGIVDQYMSAIWQERMMDVCEFQADLPANSKLVSLMAIDNYLTLVPKESDRVMIIEGFDLTTDNSTGKKLIRFNGRSLESILERRIVWRHTVLDGKLETEVRRLLNENAINPSDEKRKIPGLVFPKITNRATTNAIGDTKIYYEFYGETLLEAVKTICEQYRLGFKITLSQDKEFVFTLFSGVDRSARQTDRPAIVFSTEHGTLVSSEYVSSKAAYRNTALVIGEDPEHRCSEWATRHDYVVGYCVRYDGKQYRCKQAHTSQKDHTPDIETSLWEADDLDYKMRLVVSNAEKEPSGLNRREIFVDASSTSSRIRSDDDDDHDIFLTAAQYAKLISQEGIEKLDESHVTTAFDGKAETNVGPKYGKDYFLGDYVSAYNEYGLGTIAQITEYIRSCDESGYSAYPTFYMF